MASKLQRRVDAKICLSLTYALHDREEVLKTKLLFPLSMNQQHAVTSNNSSVYECLRRVRKTASEWKGKCTCWRGPGGCRATPPPAPSCSVSEHSDSNSGTRWTEHIKTYRWPERAHPQLPLELQGTTPCSRVSNSCFGFCSACGFTTT